MLIYKIPYSLSLNIRFLIVQNFIHSKTILNNIFIYFNKCSLRKVNIMYYCIYNRLLNNIFIYF